MDKEQASNSVSLAYIMSEYEVDLLERSTDNYDPYGYVEDQDILPECVLLNDDWIED